MTLLEGCPSLRLVVNPYLAISARQEDWNTEHGYSLGNRSNQSVSIEADQHLEKDLRAGVVLTFIDEENRSRI